MSPPREGPTFGHTAQPSSSPMGRPRQDISRRRAGAVGVSLLLHAAVLSWLGLRVVSKPTPLAPPETPTFAVELIRSPTAPQAAAREAPTEAQEASASPRPVAARSRPAVAVPARPRQPRPLPPSVLNPPPLPIPPVPSPGRSAGPAGPAAPAPSRPGAPPSRPAPGPLPGAEGAADLRGLLRATVGCSHEEYMRLSPAERARCDGGFAAARNAPRIGPTDEKLAGFARQADANARRLGQREGGLPNTLPPCDPAMVGSNLVGSCLPPEAMHTVKKF